MLFVETITNYPINSNCYVVYQDSDRSCIIIDPGTEYCNNLIIFLNTKALMPKYIVLTHSHFDHIMGVNKLREIYNIKLVCSIACNKYIIDPKKNLSLFQNMAGLKLKVADIIVEKIVLLFRD